MADAVGAVHQFGNILHGSRGGTVSPSTFGDLTAPKWCAQVAAMHWRPSGGHTRPQTAGQLKIGAGGLIWRRATGGKTVEMKKDGAQRLASGRALVGGVPACCLCTRCMALDPTTPPPHADVSELVWTKTSKGCQLGVRPRQGATINFQGFRDKASCSAAGVGRGGVHWGSGAHHDAHAGAPVLLCNAGL